MKKILVLIVVLIAALFCNTSAAVGYTDAEKYEIAADYYYKGDYMSARLIFEELGDFANSQECYNECTRLLQTIKIDNPYAVDVVRSAMLERGIVIEDFLYVFQAEMLLSLDLTDCQLSDISFLSNFINLRTLILDKNKISDIYPLKDLYELKDLSIRDNYIVDIKPLYNLTSLENLDLNYNEISDITYLENLTNLHILDISKNHICDLEPLLSIENLTTLLAYENNIAYLGILSKMTQLKELQIQGNDVNTADELATLVNLEVFDFGVARIENIVNSFPNLEYISGIDWDNNWTDDLAQFENIEGINGMYLSDFGELMNKASDIKRIAIYEPSGKVFDQLSEFINLECLEIQGDNITNLDFLSNMQNLKYLHVRSARLTDISMIANCTQLEYLFIEGAENLRDYTALMYLENLKHLRAKKYTEDTDMSSIKYLTNLEYFYMPESVGIDASWFTEMQNLKEVDISYSSANSLYGLQFCHNLEYLNIHSLGNYGDTSGHPIQLEPIEALEKLEFLCISYAHVQGEESIGELSNLRFLFTEATIYKYEKYEDILNDLDKLEYFTMQTSDVLPDLWFISNLTNLKYLGATARLDSLNGIERLTDLEYADFSLFDGWKHGITDLSPLSNLTKLKALNISGDFNNIDALCNMTEMRNLSINDSNIYDISAVANMPNLLYITASGNNISDLSPLAGLRYLAYVSVSDNPINDLSPLKEVPMLYDLWAMGTNRKYKNDNLYEFIDWYSIS